MDGHWLLYYIFTSKYFKFIAMKKAIFSPLCSAFVIPGFGQIINHDLKKGVLMLIAVLILFIAIICQLTLMIQSVINNSDISQLGPELILDKLKGEMPLSLWVLLAAFAMLWLYSVLDAFLNGKKADRQAEKGNPA